MRPIPKTFLLHTLATLCLVPSAANAETNCLYWFDSTTDVKEARIISFDGNRVTLEIDANPLPAGLHRLTMMTGNGEKWSPALCRLFFKPEVDRDLTDLSLRVNVDGTPALEKNISDVGEIIDIDASKLPVGLHRLDCTLTTRTGEAVTSAQSLFFKPNADREYSNLLLRVNVDGTKVWEKSISNVEEIIDIDASKLPVGLHRLECTLMTQTGETGTTAQALFFKPEPEIRKQDWNMTFLADGKEIWKGDLPEGEDIVILDTESLKSGPNHLVCLMTSATTGETHVAGMRDFMRPTDTPNAITGYTSPAGTEYIGKSVRNLEYSISLENSDDPEASPVNGLSVHSSLSPEIYDLSSFRMRGIRIGSKEVRVSGEQKFRERLDLRPERNAIAEIECKFDETSGEIAWSMRSLDPSTGDPTDDPSLAILPANTDGWGTAEILYEVNLAENLADGTLVDNTATIAFDNTEIAAPEWRNILDLSLPVSEIISMEETAGGYEFEISGSDSGSGIWKYELYMWNETECKWICVMTDISESHFVYSTEKSDDTPLFATVAIDKAGNREEMPSHVVGIDRLFQEENNTSAKEYFMPNGMKVSDGYNGIVIGKGLKIQKRSGKH